jgi:hypothetical protein
MQCRLVVGNGWFGVSSCYSSSKLGNPRILGKCGSINVQYKVIKKSLHLMIKIQKVARNVHWIKRFRVNPVVLVSNMRE